MQLAQWSSAWLCIGFGLYALTEGYHAVRLYGARTPCPRAGWWRAGVVGAVGFGLISAGFALRSAAAC
jgi:hypothetical protein